MKNLLYLFIFFLTACSWNSVIYSIEDDEILMRKIYNRSTCDTIYLTNGDTLCPWNVFIYNGCEIPSLVDTLRYPQYKYYYNEKYWHLKNNVAVIGLW